MSSFNPRGPRGPRRVYLGVPLVTKGFNPRGPRGPRLDRSPIAPMLTVSIHAVRGDRDSVSGCLIFVSLSFNPRGPRGPRQPSADLCLRPPGRFNPRGPRGTATSNGQHSCTFIVAFQSTRSAGTATCRSSKTFRADRRFNPRGPRGPRRYPRTARRTTHSFNPRGPRGPRPSPGCGEEPPHDVSIHAVRGDRDNANAANSRGGEFQSTRSAGTATGLCAVSPPCR